jgi:hypothetical protein
MTNRFIFFGCWNNRGCDASNPSATPLSKTIQTMQEYIRPLRPPPTMMLIAGDNYYPSKSKQSGLPKKLYDPAKIQSGFDCLDSIPITKKMILLGNHDVETTYDSVSDTTACNALKYQKGRYNGTSVVLFKFDNPGRLLYHIIGDHTIVLMFDSTIYDIADDPVKSAEYLRCYNLLRNPDSKGDSSPDMHPTNLISKTPFGSIQEIIAYQETQCRNTIGWLQEPAQRPIRNLVFSCHHPVLDMKTKKGGFKTTPLNGLTKMLYMFQVLADKRFVLLCADVHLYQHSSIIIHQGGSGDNNGDTMSIEQYVVGTGGADLDKCDGAPIGQDLVVTNDMYSFSYKIHVSDSVYGFLDCIFQGSVFEPRFVEAMRPGPSTGGSKKTRRTMIRKKRPRKTAKKNR